MERCRRFLVTLVAVAPVALAGDAVAQQKPSPYHSGLGDLMTMTVQPRHTKLGFAGREGNWPYAAYELDELKDAFERVAKVSPKWRSFAIAEMMTSVTQEP